MNETYERIRYLAKYGRHVKLDISLADMTFAQCLSHLRKEIDEFEAELHDSSSDAIYELADILCIALHLGARKGWSMQQITEAMNRKLDIRIEG